MPKATAVGVARRGTPNEGRCGRPRLMPYLLVDDTDGRVLAEIDSAERALRLLERMIRHKSTLGESLRIVRFHDSPGSLASVSSSTTFGVLPELPGAPGIPDLRR
jgi:hypothetical protein